MLEEDRVRVDWKSGKLEQNMACHACGDTNAWGQLHQCCQAQCHGTLNALQGLPYAAWGDISAAPLGPVKVKAARKLGIEYAERKPVWKKIPKKLAKGKGWKISRFIWIDINKGDDDNPSYRSRMVGKGV